MGHADSEEQEALGEVPPETTTDQGIKDLLDAAANKTESEVSPKVNAELEVPGATSATVTEPGDQSAPAQTAKEEERFASQILAFQL